MAALTRQGYLLVSAFIFTRLAECKIFNTSCQMYPSEYAYHRNSVNRAENVRVNCNNYPVGLGIHSESYIHCNGTQLKLADSHFGSEQFNSVDDYYYVWPAGIISQHLLFIFPRRVNLTTITLHYYSDSVRGLPRLRFFAVPDDHDIWEAPTVSDKQDIVGVAAVSPGGEPEGHRNVSIRFDFATKKVLMIKYGSTFSFAVSEVEFFRCLSKFQSFHLFVHSPGQS